MTSLEDFHALVMNSKSRVIRSYGKALIIVSQDARKYAVENATSQFKGNERIGRRLTGQLLSKIRITYETSPSSLPKAFVGVHGIPYGAIHEFGGTIVPKKAKNLWVKVDYKDEYKRMTPREFMEAKRFKDVGGDSYQIIKTKKRNLIAAKITKLGRGKVKIRPLFVLRKKVTIPARPYLRPAATKATKQLPMLMVRFIREEFRNARGP
jgi:phage gpG-like protein